MKVLVLGATGGTGRETVREAGAQGSVILNDPALQTNDVVSESSCLIKSPGA
jgi:NAD(P)-dependent dehydrogenase (short-subunit alcohol dehydrogenase family)